MKKIIIRMAVAVLQLLNMFLKPLKLKEKVVIISRQSDVPTLDIQLLADCLAANKIETVVLTKTLNKSFRGAISYGLQMLVQMFYIATSKVVVLDGYCILVSILPKKQGQTVVQMWHALGAIKKFGWQTVDCPDGSSRVVAENMQMHRNYDYVLAPGRITGTYFAEAFRTPKEKLVFYGLPRIDFLRQSDDENKEAIMKTYPSAAEKINVLYVPTFRKNAALELERLVAGFDFHNMNLIIKKHFLDKGDYDWAVEAGAIVDQQFSSMEWLRFCDKVITDYSAIAFEASILDLDLYIFQPDAASYQHNVGLNVNLKEEAIGPYVCVSEQELFDVLKLQYEKAAVKAFREKYIEINLDNCTQSLVDFLRGLL